jgi:hypothetical protein
MGHFMFLNDQIQPLGAKGQTLHYDSPFSFSDDVNVVGCVTYK